MPLLAGAHGDGAPRAADAGIDDREVNPDRRVGKRVGEDRRRLADVMAADPVADVDDVGSGRDPRDHGATHPGEIVGDAVVRQEGDRKAHDPGLTLDH